MLNLRVYKYYVAMFLKNEPLNKLEVMIGCSTDVMVSVMTYLQFILRICLKNTNAFLNCNMFLQ